VFSLAIERWQEEDFIYILAKLWKLFNPGEGLDYPHLSRPALEPTQLPVKWVPAILRGLSTAGVCC
jgi:hypothetical protein